MTIVQRVEVPTTAYDVTIGTGLLAGVGDYLRGLTEASTVALVSDETVAAQYATGVDVQLARAGFSVVSLTVPPGESSKSWAMAGGLCEELAARAVSRTDVVVALGGGVIGDLAGFVSAVYLRGVDFVQVPTTLLAMVDSSVGGKTAVDLKAGKNLAGAFKQPLGVLADTSLLETLPDAEWLSGIAEVAKTAVLDGDGFVEWLEASAESVLRREPDAVQRIVSDCVRFKSGIVARDEKEEGPRECLNYGHTLGHAIEKVLGYGTVTHGAAVAEGMRFASRVAVQVSGASADFVKRQDRLLDNLGLEVLPMHVEPALLLEAMRSDKKSRSGVVRMVLATAPGQWACVPVDDGVISAHLSAWAATKGGQ